MTLLAAALCHASADAMGKGSPQKPEYLKRGKAAGVSIFRLRMHAMVEGTESQTVSSFCRMKRDGPMSWQAGSAAAWRTRNSRRYQQKSSRLWETRWCRK